MAAGHTAWRAACVCHMHACTHAHTHARTHAHTHAFVHACKHVCMNACTCSYARAELHGGPTAAVEHALLEWATHVATHVAGCTCGCTCGCTYGRTCGCTCGRTFFTCLIHCCDRLSLCFYVFAFDGFCRAPSELARASGRMAPQLRWLYGDGMYCSEVSLVQRGQFNEASSTRPVQRG